MRVEGARAPSANRVSFGEERGREEGDEDEEKEEEAEGEEDCGSVGNETIPTPPAPPHCLPNLVLPRACRARTSITPAATCTSAVT